MKSTLVVLFGLFWGPQFAFAQAKEAPVLSPDPLNSEVVVLIPLKSFGITINTFLKTTSLYWHFKYFDSSSNFRYSEKEFHPFKTQEECEAKRQEIEEQGRNQHYKVDPCESYTVRLEDKIQVLPIHEYRTFITETLGALTAIIESNKPIQEFLTDVDIKRMVFNIEVNMDGAVEPTELPVNLMIQSGTTSTTSGDNQITFNFVKDANGLHALSPAEIHQALETLRPQYWAKKEEYSRQKEEARVLSESANKNFAELKIQLKSDNIFR